jgi:hypothetical protein
MMFLMTLFSVFCLLTGSIVANPSIDIIHQHHLETVEGRTTFLANKLNSYIAAADQLNNEIQILAEGIKALSPENDQPQIIALTEEMTIKMDKLLPMMPVMDMALTVDEDFQQLDTILHQTDPLSPEQLQVIDRIASLCSSIDKF